jgi:peptide/nickel transport system ATP-binding protein
MLKLEGVSKVYHVGTFGGKELKAVNNVNFDINDREIVSLIGESGSGKSTIGKMILKLISISSGTIRYDGVDIDTFKGNKEKEYYLKVQGVFQDPFSTFNPIFKADRIFSFVKEEFFPHVSKADWEKKVRDTLLIVGLNPEHVLNKYPHQLSGGQLQRFLIARALLMDINFLVADEIISMLDASTRIDVLNLLADLKGRGLSVLFITHDLSLAHYISDKSIILYRGHIVEKGSTDKIFSNPMHPYTQLLMAAVPRLDRKWEETQVVLEAIEEGYTNICPFYARCKDAGRGEACKAGVPELRELEPDHFVSCVAR